MKKIPVIAFNSPPGSGKDTVASLLVEIIEYQGHTVKSFSFKDSLYEYAYQYISHLLLYEDFLFLCTNRILKDKKNPLLFDMSPRNFLIFVSERHAKVVNGENVWATAVAEKIKTLETDNFSIITDLGFQNEYYLLEKTFDLYVINLQREGTSFNNDSRSWIDNDRNVPIIEIDNNGSPTQAARSIVDALNKTNLSI